MMGCGTFRCPEIWNFDKKKAGEDNQSGAKFEAVDLFLVLPECCMCVGPFCPY